MSAELRQPAGARSRPAQFTVTVMVTVPLAPGSSVPPIVQVTVPVAPAAGAEMVHEVSEAGSAPHAALVKLVKGGVTSEMTMFCRGMVPFGLAYEIVYATVLPGGALTTLADLSSVMGSLMNVTEALGAAVPAATC